MADIQSKILSKYDIDIAQENLFRLYKLDKADVTDQELQTFIDATRKRWNQSTNGANEKNAERDRARLEKANKYEAILKDAKLRKELYAFYNGGGEEKAKAESGAPLGGLDFAREYFKLLETSKKIKKYDVEFFFKYYQSERINKKTILEMLEKEFKIIGLGKEGKYADDNDVNSEGNTKDDSSPLIVNLFQEATIIKLHKCDELYKTAIQSNDVCQKYPTIRDGLYDFLGLKGIDTIQQFADDMSVKSKEVYAVRQERGTEFVPLVDLFNMLQVLAGYRDVVDNYQEFTLLIKYPNLSPYMYSFTEMKKSTMKGIIDVANRDYAFRDDSDFILTYYNLVHDNFGITNSGIGDLLRKAEKKAKANKVLNDIDEKLGRKKKRKISISAEIIHWLIYFPIFLVYFVFEVFKAVFTELHKFVIPVFAVLFVGTNWLLPNLLGVENLLYLRKVFSKAEWYAYLDNYFSVNINNGFEAVVLSLIVILIMLAIYVLPPLFVALFIWEAADDLNKRYDWIGYERTFQKIFSILRKKTEDQYIGQKRSFVKSKISKIIINLTCLVIVILIVYFTPIGLKTFSKKMGYYSKEVISEQYKSESTKDSDEIDQTLMVITVRSANIRSGPGQDYDSLMVASEGDIFLATGKEETASNGRIWYEIYIDKDSTEIGWASEKVISKQ